MKLIYLFIFFLITSTNITAKDNTHTFNSNVEIINLNIKKIPKCDNYKNIRNYIYIENIQLPLFGYSKKTKKHDKLIGTANEMLKLKNKYFVCKKNNIIKFKHVSILEIQN